MARIPVRSKPIAEIVDAVKNVALQDAKDIWIMGLNTANYGIDLPEHKPQLHKVIREISAIEGISRINIISLVFPNMYDELLEELSSNPKVSYIEFGAQTGSNKMHFIMNTGTTVEDIEKVLVRLPHKKVQCLFIVGHPGETDEDFEETLNLIRKYKLWNARITPYILVEGTPASKMDQIPKEIIRKRVQQVKNLKSILKEDYLKTLHCGQRTYGYPYKCIEEYDGALQLYLEHGESHLTLISEPIYDESEKNKVDNLSKYSKVNGTITGFSKNGTPIIKMEL